MTNHDHHADHAGSRVVERHCDIAIIGGAAAGLAAALQLARQRRTVIVVEDGTPRNAPAARMHGYLGREGTSPAELAAVGREEVNSYGGEVLRGRALAVRRSEAGEFEIDLTGGNRLIARRVLAATGITDELPAIEGVAPHWGKGVIHCPFCHGFEVRDRRLVQIVTHPMGLHPTPILRHLTDQLTVVLHSPDGVDETQVAALVDSGVPVLGEKVVRVLSADDQHLTGVELASGETLDADAVLVGPGFHARADIFASVGLSTTPHASGLGDVVEIDPTGLTAVPGLYAAGNLTDPSMQVLQAAAHGSRVGAMIAFSLADEDVRAASRAHGVQTDWDRLYGGDDHRWSANPNGTFIREIADLPPGRALDVGAGEGADALWLVEHGWQVTASDVSGNALARVRAEAERRHLEVECLHGDANDLDVFPIGAYDLVSLQYGSFLRTPDNRGLDNLLGAVAPGGTLLAVSHDLAPLQEPVDVASQTRMFDPGAYVGVEEIAAALKSDPAWTIEVHETRPRPPGAATTHHVDDVVLRARKAG